MATDPAYGPWEPLTLRQVTDLMTEAPMRWWVTGGHALELHFGQSWRSHDDIDISVLRSDVRQLHWHLRSWDIHVAAAGVLAPWTGQALTSDRSQNNLWCKRATNEPWCLDIVLSDGDIDSWIYRRDPSIQRPWPTAVLRTAAGVPYLSPELQLLFKSRNHRPKDDVDAHTTIPLLDRGQQSWLKSHLDDDHAWQQLLR